MWEASERTFLCGISGPMTCKDCGTSIDDEDKPRRRFCSACQHARRLTTCARYRERNRKLPPLKGNFRPGSPSHWNALHACELCDRTIRNAGIVGHVGRAHGMTFPDLRQRCPRMAARAVTSFPTLAQRQRIRNFKQKASNE